MPKYYYLLSSLALVIFIHSCSIQKRVHRPGYHIEWKNKMNTASTKNDRVNENKKSIQELITQNQPFYEIENISIIDSTIDIASISNDAPSTYPTEVHHSHIFEKKYLVENCDKIVLKDGQEINTKETKVSDNFITFQKCNEQNGTSYKIEKSSVLIIQYSNGKSQIFDSNKKIEKLGIEHQRTEVFSVLSLVLGIIGILVVLFLSILGGGIISLAAFIFGLIGQYRIQKNHKKFKGRGFAIAGILLGVIGIILTIIFMAKIVQWLS